VYTVKVPRLWNETIVAHRRLLQTRRATAKSVPVIEPNIPVLAQLSVGYAGMTTRSLASAQNMTSFGYSQQRIRVIRVNQSVSMTPEGTPTTSAVSANLRTRDVVILAAALRALWAECGYQ
jgi:hypothetical protein